MPSEIAGYWNPAAHRNDSERNGFDSSNGQRSRTCLVRFHKHWITTRQPAVLSLCPVIRTNVHGGISCLTTKKKKSARTRHVLALPNPTVNTAARRVKAQAM